MKLYYSQNSPFVRKVLVVAFEAGIGDSIERIDCTTTTPTDPDAVLANPLKKIPALETDDGVTLFDSRVICEYLDTEIGDGSFFPRGAIARWRALRLQSVADGIMDAVVLARYESVLRPEPFRWNDWIEGQMSKVDGALADLENHAQSFGDRIDIGTISAGVAAAYLDFRVAHKDWRSKCPALAAWFETFSQRPSMQATQPPNAVAPS